MSAERLCMYCKTCSVALELSSAPPHFENMSPEEIARAVPRDRLGDVTKFIREHNGHAWEPITIEPLKEEIS